MRYDLCQKRGLPVGSGVAKAPASESSAADSMGLNAHWSKAGANALLAVERYFKNNRWADFLDSRACSAAAA